MQTPVPPLPPGLDPNYVFSQMTPIIGVVVVLVVGALALRAIFRTPLGEALAERLRHRAAHRWGVAGEDAPRVAALEGHVSRLEEQISELAERLDFAERLLAEQRGRSLGAGP